MEPPIEEDTFKMPSNLPVEKPETVDIPKNPTASPTNPENPYKVPLCKYIKTMLKISKYN